KKQQEKAVTYDDLIGSMVNEALANVEKAAKERIAEEKKIDVSKVVLDEKSITAADCSAMSSVDSEVYNVAERAQEVDGDNAKLDTNVPGGKLFGLINLSATPSNNIFSWTILIPLLAGITGFLLSWLSQKSSAMTQDPQAQGGCSGKTMMYVMPLITVFFCFSVNCALGLYWTIGNVLGIGQHFILHKMYDPAKVLAEAEEKIQREKEQKKAKKSAAAAKKAAAIEATRKKNK
ncbi:MAG: YidC/Oxa1 family membrane protein insertase, partial [Clostridia bacterium]|nr:YidC/Oxa1 family membrane protein insertase [Clostridia bacterium]